MAVNIAVAGDNLGAIVVGDNNTVVINQPAGAVVLPVQPVKTTRREGSANLGPRPFPDIVDRVDEDRQSRTALTAVPPSSVDVSGPPGIGKTALLRHVCGDAGTQKSFPDGTIYFDGAGQSASDVLQQIFEALFETDRPFKPDDTELRKFLARTTPLVMLDGFLGSSAEFDRLLNLAATTTFAVSGPQRVLLGEGCSIALGGLQPGDALALMSRELARPLDQSEVMPARAICAALDENPRDVILVAAHARVYGVPLTQLAEEVRAADSPEAWLGDLIRSKLSDRDRAALAAFAAVECAPLDDSEVGAIGGEPAAQSLEGLKDRRLVDFDGKRNRVRAGLVASIAMSFLGMLPAQAAAQFFLHAAAQSQQATLVEHSDAILGALKNAALSGNHADVMTLAHRAGDAVALSGRWDRWQEMLQQALASAKAAHDSAGEAWALHQLGSRALALGDVAAAQSALQAALHIRTGLGDPNAIAVTQHNLELLAAPTPAPSAHAEASATRWGLTTKIAVGIAFFVLLGSLGAWVAARPSLSLHAVKPKIARGQTTTLCYTASHVSNVRINGVLATNGCVAVHPARTTVYKVEATGLLGIPVAQSVVVVVAPPRPNPPAPIATAPIPQKHPTPAAPPPAKTEHPPIPIYPRPPRPTAHPVPTRTPHPVPTRTAHPLPTKTRHPKPTCPPNIDVAYDVATIDCRTPHPRPTPKPPHRVPTPTPQPLRPTPTPVPTKTSHPRPTCGPAIYEYEVGTVRCRPPHPQPTFNPAREPTPTPYPTRRVPPNQIYYGEPGSPSSKPYNPYSRPATPRPTTPRPNPPPIDQRGATHVRRTK